MLLQVLLNGLLVGGLYALMGLGFSLQWGISGIINLTYGGTVILGAYLSFTFFRIFGLQPVLSAIPASAILFAFGFMVYQFFLRPILRYGSFVITLIMTFAIELVLENIMLLVWASDYRMVSSIYSVLRIGKLSLPINKVIIFTVALFLTYLVYLFMAKTNYGRAIQASALNLTGAQIIGIDVQKMYAINFALGSAIGGAAGALMSTLSAFSVVMTGLLLSKAFVIAILGGLGNILGALLGGVTLGLAESIGITIFGPAYSEAIGLMVMVIVLVLKPRGLIGRKYWTV